jgi:hypothetical protein
MEGRDLEPFIESNGHSAGFSSEHGTADLDVRTGTTPAFQSLQIEQQIDIDAGPLRQGFYGVEEGAVRTYIGRHKIQTLVISVLTNHFDRSGGSNTKPLEFSLLFHTLVRKLNKGKPS